MHSVAKPRLSKGSTPRRDGTIDDKAAEGEKFTEEVHRPHLSESLRSYKWLSFAKIPRIMFTIIEYYFFKKTTYLLDCSLFTIARMVRTILKIQRPK